MMVWLRPGVYMYMYEWRATSTVTLHRVYWETQTIKTQTIKKKTIKIQKKTIKTQIITTQTIKIITKTQKKNNKNTKLIITSSHNYETYNNKVLCCL